MSRPRLTSRTLCAMLLRMKSVTINLKDGTTHAWAVPDASTHVIIARSRKSNGDPIFAPVASDHIVPALVKYTNQGKSVTAYPIINGTVRENS